MISKKGKIIIFSIKIFFAVVILLVIAELACQAFIINPSILRNYGYNPDGLGDLLPNRKFVDNLSEKLPYFMATNSFGLRNEEEVDFDSKTFRILVIGDSFTFSPHVNNQDTWPAVLERKLREKYPGEKIQVLNAGVLGYTITDELDYLREKGVKIKPSLVILGVYTNDLNDLKPDQKAIYSRRVQKTKQAGLKGYLARQLTKSALFSLLGEYRLKLAKPNISRTDFEKIPQLKYIQEYETNIQNFIRFCDQEKFKLLVVLFPSIADLVENNYDFQKIIIKVLNGKVDYLDLSEFFRKHSASDLYFPKNDHLNGYGNYLTAETLLDYLLKKNLVAEN